MLLPQINRFTAFLLSVIARRNDEAIFLIEDMLYEMSVCGTWRPLVPLFITSPLPIEKIGMRALHCNRV